MVFNSGIFLVFFPIFFLLYWWVSRKFNIRSRNILILLGSYVFYAGWDWRFLGLIILSSITDFLVGKYLGSVKEKKTRTLLLVVSLVVNLCLLGFFKYYGFFVDSFIDLAGLFGMHLNERTLEVILPVGISFYTFQTLSYTIDIYRGKLEPTKDAVSFFAFVAFFPQLVAGPIERAANLLPQFQRKISFDYAQAVSGLRLMLWGFFKKIVIADNAGVIVDNIFELDDANGLTVIFACILLAFQFYGDFSGYSDIAIGLARMLGFDLMKNFNSPFFAGTFAKLWQGWHISLTTWFRDYLYIPLGGNRHGQYRTYLNLFITFLVSGLWHGAEITFVAWGGLCGIILVLERMVGLGKVDRVKIPYGFILFMILLIPFRAEDLHHMGQLSTSVVDFSNYSLGQVSHQIQLFSITKSLTVLFVLAFFMVIDYLLIDSDFDQWVSRFSKPVRWAIYYSVILAIIFIGNFSVKPDFMYFQF